MNYVHTYLLPILATHLKASLNIKAAGINPHGHLDCPEGTTTIPRAEKGGKLAVEGKQGNLGNSKQKAPAGTVLQRNAHRGKEARDGAKIHAHCGQREEIGLR